jgi:hypothetical protein
VGFEKRHVTLFLEHGTYISLKREKVITATIRKEKANRRAKDNYY